MAVLRQVLGRLGLRLNEEKTRRVNAWREYFDFLGFTFTLRKSRRSGKYYPHVEPSKASIQRIKSRVTQLTGRRLASIPLPDVLSNLNRSLRGWSGYFHYRNSTTAFNRVKWHVEERVRIHLRRRHKLKSRAAGYARFPSSKLYTLGLFKLPTTAGWKIA